MKRFLAGLLLLAACSTTAPPPLPQWDTVPPFVLTALCARLRMDAFATSGGLHVVPATRPIATPGAVVSAAGMTRRQLTPAQVSAAMEEANRVLPVAIEETPCGFVPLRRAPRGDETVVELSAPLHHPGGGGVGLLARVSLGAEQEWYWIRLGSRGDRWGVAAVNAIAR